MDEFAILYDEAFDRGGVTPQQVDDLPLWEVSAMLGRNRPMEREAWPEDAPNIRVLRRHLALSEGREVPGRDDPISDDEYRDLLAMARGGTRRAVDQ